MKSDKGWKRFSLWALVLLAACRPTTRTATQTLPVATTALASDTPVPQLTRTAAPTLAPTIPAATVELDGALYVGDYLNDAIYRISYGVP